MAGAAHGTGGPPPGHGQATTVYTSCLWLLDSMCDVEPEEPSNLRQPLKSLAAAAAEAAATAPISGQPSRAAGASTRACDGAHLIAQGSSKEMHLLASWHGASSKHALPSLPEPDSPRIASARGCKPPPVLPPAPPVPQQLPERGHRLRAAAQGMGQLRRVGAHLRRLSEHALETGSHRIAALASGAASAAASQQEQGQGLGQLRGRLRRFSDRALEAGRQRIAGVANAAASPKQAEQEHAVQGFAARLRRYAEQLHLPAAAAGAGPAVEQPTAAAPAGYLAAQEATVLGSTSGSGSGCSQGLLTADLNVQLSHASVEEMRACDSWMAAAQERELLLGPEAGIPSSASILPSAASAASRPQQRQGLRDLGAVFRRLSEQWLAPAAALSASGSCSHAAAAQPAGSGAAPAAAPAAALPAVSIVAAAAATAAKSESADILELALAESSSEDGTVLGPAGAAGCYPHISPAHLIAPAPQAAPWQLPTPVPPAVAGTGSSILATTADRRAGCEPQWQHGQQQAAQQGWVQQDEQHQALELETTALLSEQSGLSSLSASTTSYSAEPAHGAHHYPSQLPSVNGGSGSADQDARIGSWQRAREEGHVRRSLAHPIFGLQPERHEEDDQQLGRHARGQGQGQQRSLAGLKALAAAQWRLSPDNTPTAAKAWTLGTSHIQFDLRETSGQPHPQSPPPAERWQRQQAAAQIGAAAAGQYAALSQQLEQLNLKRARQAVRASLKREKKARAASLGGAPASAPSLLQRMLGGCFRPADSGCSRKLRRELKRQRVHLLCLGRIPYDPDQPLHFQLWQAVSLAFAGWDAAASLQRDPTLPAWQVLGFSAANPAAELADTGLMGLLLLVLLADCTPRLATELLATSASVLGEGTLAASAVEATQWALRLLRSGELTAEAQRLGSTCMAAEFFFLSSMSCFLQELRQASPQVLSLPPARSLRALLSLAEEQVCSDVHAAVLCGQQLVG